MIELLKAYDYRTRLFVSKEVFRLSVIHQLSANNNNWFTHIKIDKRKSKFLLSYIILIDGNDKETQSQTSNKTYFAWMPVSLSVDACKD